MRVRLCLLVKLVTSTAIAVVKRFNSLLSLNKFIIWNTNPPKSQCFITTAVYFLLMLHPGNRVGCSPAGSPPGNVFIPGFGLKGQPSAGTHRARGKGKQTRELAETCRGSQGVLACRSRPPSGLGQWGQEEPLLRRRHTAVGGSPQDGGRHQGQQHSTTYSRDTWIPTSIPTALQQSAWRCVLQLEKNFFLPL